MCRGDRSPGDFMGREGQGSEEGCLVRGTEPVWLSFCLGKGERNPVGAGPMHRIPWQPRSQGCTWYGLGCEFCSLCTSSFTSCAVHCSAPSVFLFVPLLLLFPLGNNAGSVSMCRRLSASVPSLRHSDFVPLTACPLRSRLPTPHRGSHPGSLGTGSTSPSNVGTAQSVPSALC